MTIFGPTLELTVKEFEHYVRLFLNSGTINPTMTIDSQIEHLMLWKIKPPCRYTFLPLTCSYSIGCFFAVRISV